jgi:hypothetical protein
MLASVILAAIPSIIVPSHKERKKHAAQSINLVDTTTSWRCFILLGFWITFRIG